MMAISGVFRGKYADAILSFWVSKPRAIGTIATVATVLFEQHIWWLNVPNEYPIMHAFIILYNRIW